MLARRSRIPREQLGRRRACLLDQRSIALEVRESQQRCARLPGAEELARTAHHKVAPRDLESVAGLVDHLQPLARGLRKRLLVQQDAEALLRAAADAPAQLMQLREAKALRML